MHKHLRKLEKKKKDLPCRGSIRIGFLKFTGYRSIDCMISSLELVHLMNIVDYNMSSDLGICSIPCPLA